jgi:acylphosphatase
MHRVRLSFRENRVAQVKVWSPRAYCVGVVRRRVLISGHVQGVFFRDTCRRTAERYGVSGWVRNLPDGSVEAVFEGPAAAVRHLVEWTRHGPRSAVVEYVRVREEPPEGISGFQIR